jgi:Tol biopolymer transport system component
MQRTTVAVIGCVLLVAIAAGSLQAAKAPWRIALTTDRAGDSDIYAMDADGTHVRQLTRSPRFDGAGQFSPDGRKLLYYRNQSGVWVMNANGSGKRNLTAGDPGFNAPGGWAPDGRRILFTSNRDGNDEVYVMNADGSGQRNLVAAPSSEEFAGLWSPNGRTILFTSDRDGNWEIYAADADGRNSRNVTRSPGIDGRNGYLWSPDSRRIVFASTRDTRDQDNPELYVMNPDGSGVRRLTHLPGQEWPLSWSPDGSKIAFGRYPAKPRWAFWVMNADGTGARKVTWSLPGKP